MGIKRLGFAILVTLSVFAATPHRAWAADYRTVGFMIGGSFPKALVGAAELNVAENWAFDYQASASLFWAIQQIDVLYYWWRSDWSPYVGLGTQSWNFYGAASSSPVSGVVFGSGSNAYTATVPLGFLYVADSGFAFDIRVAADVFVSAPYDMKGKLVPEGEILIGYFF